MMRSPQIRVMHVMEDFSLGGSQIVAIGICSGLNPSRYKPYIASVVHGGPLIAAVPGSVRSFVCGNRRSRKDTFGWIEPRVIETLMRLLIAEKIDIVQTHLWAASIIGRIAAGLAGIPVVIDTLHNTYNWKGVDEILVDRWLATATNQIVCVSQSVADFVIDQEGLSRSKVSVIYNGVNTDLFAPGNTLATLRRRFGIEHGRCVVGCVARLVEQKRVTDVVAAAPRILSAIPSATFIIVGDGPLRASLLADVRNAGLHNAFRFVGARRDMPDVYRLFDVLIQAGSREGFSLATVEAMSTGVPVVAAGLGPLREIILPHSTGLLYEVGDTMELARQVIEVLQRHEWRHALGKAARESVLARFRIDRMVHEYQQLYENLLLAR